MSFLALGAQPAFINYNLQGESLKHCISILDATLVVYDEDVADNVKALDRSDLPKLYEWRDGLSLTAKEKKSPRKSPGVVVDPDTWSTLSKERMPDSHRRNVQWKDPACYIYTSCVSTFVFRGWLTLSPSEELQACQKQRRRIMPKLLLLD